MPEDRCADLSPGRNWTCDLNAGHTGLHRALEVQDQWMRVHAWGQEAGILDGYLSALAKDGG